MQINETTGAAGRSVRGSGRRMINVATRLRIGLVFAAVGLAAATGVRTARLAEAWPDADVEVRAIEVSSLRGGLLVEPSDAGWTVRSLRSGAVRSLEPGLAIEVGRVRLVLDPADGLRRTEIFRRPWSVFGPTDGGHTRIDVGPDPLGVADGVRDRIVVPGDPADGGWLHLVPRSGSRFGPDDAGAVAVLVERDGLRVDGLERAAGERLDVGRRFEVDDGGLRLEFRWESAVRAIPVADGAGRIIGYREASGTDLVVTSLEAQDGSLGRTRLDVIDDAGDTVVRLALSTEHPTLLHGRRDRVSPLRGRVLPPVAPNEELEQAVHDGLTAGWVRVGPDRTTVEVPPNQAGDGPREDLGWTLASAVVTLIDAYDRARAPVALRLGPGLRPAGGSVSDARPGPLRYDAELNAWTPSEQPTADGPVVFTLPIVPDAEEVTIAAAFPIAWATSPHGDWRTEPSPPPGRWREWTLEVPGAETLLVRMDATVAPFERTTPGRAAVSVAGAPEGTYLDADGVRMGTRAFDGWSSRGARHQRAAARLWRELPGDRWSASVDTTAAAQGAERLYLRIPITARQAGWTALDVTVPGRVLSAAWNDEPLPPAGLTPPPDGGSGRLSLPSRAGRNLLALEIELPPRGPAARAGGVRFRVNADGQPVALGARVADRRARAPVRDGLEPPPLLDRDGADAAWLEVERAGVGDLTVGQRWRVAPAPNVAAEAVLTLASRTRTLVTALPPEDVPQLIVAAAEDGTLEVTAPVAGTLWTADGRPLGVVPHVATDWPRGARLVLDGYLLRLRRPRAEEEEELSARPDWLARWDDAAGRITLDDDLQADVAAALAEELEALPESDGDTLALRGVVLVMDGRTGDILACASEDRRDADPDTIVREACWKDAGVHPGSTFKLATAGAALRSTDPAVRRMLDGQPPAELTRGGPRGTLQGVKLPALPTTSKPLLLRTRLRNFRGRAVPVDADLTDAIRGSFNTWFAYVGLLMHRPLREGWLGSAVAEGSARDAAWPVAAYARTAGFDRRLELGGGYVGTGGHVPSGAPDSDAAIAARSVGQDAVTASPLGIAALLAAAVEGGQTPAPRLSQDRPVTHTALLTPDQAGRLLQGLSEVVSRGTARAAFAENPRRGRIVGKTGSAQRIDGHGLQRTDAWFAGAVLPPEGLDESSVIVVVSLPGAGLGGRHAAALADRITRRIAEQRGW